MRKPKENDRNRPGTKGTVACEIKAAGPYKFIGFGGVDVTKPYKGIGFGDIDAPEPFEFTGSSGFYFANTGINPTDGPDTQDPKGPFAM